jgi:hypothetical protein
MNLSISSTAAGSQPSAACVASMADATEAKCPTPITRCLGAATSPTVAAVTTASVPSEPTTSRERSNSGAAARRSSR